ncbi:MAG: nitronate monooxygenase [Bacteroidaceae bacterium]|nr:nitronate monooxygenase [Bacteroidaceae bacterium]
MNRICTLFGIDKPIIQGGMVWISGWRLAAAVSNNGGMGLLGAGSMTPDLLNEHIDKLTAATDKPWGINIPLMNPASADFIRIAIERHAPVVVTSAGSPKKYTALLHDHGIKVAHVVASSAFARKCEAAGVDAVVAEGFEAGGHNGREETTTLTLIPQVRQATTLPLIAAGGIASGQAIYAMMALGAEGVQIGTLFALTQESSASTAFKQRCTTLEEGDTMLTLKALSPTRLVKNALYQRIAEAEQQGATAEQLLALVPKGSARRGIFEDDTDNGEVEIGQVASAIRSIDTVADVMQRLTDEFRRTKQQAIAWTLDS